LNSLQLSATVVAAETIETVTVAIVFVICAGLMLVPIAAFAILVFVELRALRAERRRDLDANATTRLETGAYGGAR
jgi:hypothetical protein